MEARWPARAACRSASRGSCSKQKQIDLEVQRNSWNQIHTIRHSHTSYFTRFVIHSVLVWLDCLTQKMPWQCAISFRWDAALVLLKVHKCFPANQHVEFALVDALGRVSRNVKSPRCPSMSIIQIDISFHRKQKLLSPRQKLLFYTAVVFKLNLSTTFCFIHEFFYHWSQNVFCVF